VALSQYSPGLRLAAGKMKNPPTERSTKVDVIARLNCLLPSKSHTVFAYGVCAAENAINHLPASRASLHLDLHACGCMQNGVDESQTAFGAPRTACEI